MNKGILFIIFIGNIHAALAQEYTEKEFKFLHALVGTWTMETSRGNRIVYSPTVTNQNNGQPVRFELISTTGHRYIFENKKHDFPQRVIYHLVSNNAVHARIEGTKNGKQMGVRLSLQPSALINRETGFCRYWE